MHGETVKCYALFETHHFQTAC